LKVKKREKEGGRKKGKGGRVKKIKEIRPCLQAARRK
jgi:hypothetical protein